jgi:hypothetical protein
MKEDIMKKYLQLANHILLMTAPAIASSMFAVSPTHAATFALSEGQVVFRNFSQSPFETDSRAEANTFTIANSGSATADADAEANFRIEPPDAFNFSLSRVLGEGRDYSATAESQTLVVGLFEIEANTLFSFDFIADLSLETSIDNAPAENASAIGDISFALIDNTNGNFLEFISLVANINTLGDDDFIDTQTSENITLIDLNRESNFGGNKESIQLSAIGSLQRTFIEKTSLTLVGVKRNQARVKAPEPSSILALVVSGSVIGIVLKDRRKYKSIALQR